MNDNRGNGRRQPGAALRRRLLLGLVPAVAFAAPAIGQVVPQGVTVGQPVGLPGSLPAALPEGVTVADPFRVYGDDAPVFSGFGLLSALGLHGSASVSTEYNDNVPRFSSASSGTGRYRSKTDWIIRPQATLTGGHMIGRQQLFAAATFGRDFYARNHVLNRDRMGLSGGVNWALGARCGGTMKAAYSKRGTQFGFFDDVVPSTQKSWDLQAGGSCRTATGLSLSLNYDRFQTTNKTDDPLGVIDRSWADVKGQSVGGGIGYPIGRRGEIGVQGNWSKQHFPHQFLPWGDTNGSTIWGANFYGRYKIGAFLEANAGIGKNWVRPDNPFSSEFSGLSWNAGLKYTGPRLGLSAQAGRSANGSSGGIYNYTIGRYENLTATYRLNRRLSLNTGAAFSNMEYNGFTLVPETVDVTRSKDQRYFVGADYQLNQMMSVSLDYNHHRRTSIPSMFDYHVNSAILTLRAQF